MYRIGTNSPALILRRARNELKRLRKLELAKPAISWQPFHMWLIAQQEQIIAASIR